MPRLLRICLLALLLAPAVSSRAAPETACPPATESPTPEAIQTATRNARDHGFLWRISRDGRTSYLYGTIHVAKLDWIVPGPTVMGALRATDTIALELDLLDAEIQAAMSKGLAALPNVALSDALAKRVRRQAESACLPYDSVGKLSPEMQVVTLTLMAGRWDGLDAAYGTDIVLAAVGHAAKKNMVSLETPESQLKVLHAHDAREIADFVEAGLDELETGRARRMLSRLAGVWASADYTNMADYEQWCECLNTPIERETMKRALDDRNPGLADRIDGLHNAGKQVFAAVGSLHMFGSTGLPAQMARRGYQVDRVSLETR
jgi:hypothetical protein